MFERVISGRLRDHLDDGGHYNPAQYGFRRRRGTTHAIATETVAVHQASGYRCNLVQRDVSKAFDKVWHLGLKFKLLHLGLPGPVERLLCDFLSDRTARIRVVRHLGPAFPLDTGVPQGSVLSPTLYAIYTNDCPVSLAGLNIQYADDITQVVHHPGRSRAMLNARTGREIARINTYEADWRIRTNLTKFAVIPLATLHPEPLLVDDEPVDLRSHGTMLGLRISTRGYTSHVTERVVRARTALTSLFRFRDLPPGIKLHLVKALVIPVLLYPPIPMHALSRRSLSRLQRVQNAALRFAFNVRWEEFRTSESLHFEASLQPVNLRLHLMAEAVWQRMEAEEWEQFLTLQELHREAPDRSHSWFPRSLRLIEENGPPIPRYK